MKNFYLTVLVLVQINLSLFAQNYPVGKSQMSFTDPDRSRTISTQVYYPATSAGTDVPWQNGQFPLIIYGHGFSMNYDAYTHITDSLIPKGYIIVFPTTEIGPIPFPSHENFAGDMKFLNTYIKSQNSVSTSPFYQHVSNNSAFLGHSMGGGCSYLAAENNSNITTMVNFAAAETNTSAITAATNISIPALVFSGENDGVAPPDENQTLMYNNLASTCKTHVTINGGGHCYFALSNWACDFGEGSSSPQPTITREEQQEVMFSILIPYLNYYLKNNTIAGAQFLNILQTSQEITYDRNCSTNILSKNLINPSIYPNPAENEIQIISDINGAFDVIISDINGKQLNIYSNTNSSIDISHLNSGVYLITIKSANFSQIQKFVKL